MSYKVHVFIGIVLTFAMFFGIILYNYYYFGKMNTLLIFIEIIIGVLAVRFLWRLVPVKCLSGNCNGKAYCKGSKPIIYECSKCGYIHTTSISEGSGGDW
jgi:hypothetical protein